MRELYGMGLTFRVLALGVKGAFLYRNITARLLIGTLWTASCAALTRAAQPRRMIITRKPAKKPRVLLERMRYPFKLPLLLAQYSGGSKRR